MPRGTTNLPRYAAVAAVIAAASLARASDAGIESTYLFHLSDLHGSIPMSWPTLTFDPVARELYVNDRSSGGVRVFRDSGMQVQAFGEDDTFGTIVDLAIREDGDLLVLTVVKGQTVVVRCDFRGEPRDALQLSGVPAEFAKDFYPNAIRLVAGSIYLADKERMKVLVTDDRGAYQRSYDLQPMLKVSEKKRADAAMTGFNVDHAGNLLFTISALFTAYVVSPSGEIRTFGSRGSAPGKFNIAGAIAADERGYLYVTDILRAVVMVFDPSFEFLGEFGYRGYGPENLVTPIDLALDQGKVFVAQGAMRGVSVFRVSIRDGVSRGG